MPPTSDGLIQVETMDVNGQPWKVHAIGGTPAQAVLHGVLEIMPQKPSLAVSGINYGENLTCGITVSGTVGAALEAASVGIPAIAVSLETAREHHLSYSNEVDFSSAAYFAAFFAARVLEKGLPAGADMLKVDVPSGATPETPWRWTRLSHQHYYIPVAPKRASWDVPGRVGYELAIDLDDEPPDTDAYAVLVKRWVSVTPLTLDLTAGVPRAELDRFAA